MTEWSPGSCSPVFIVMFGIPGGSLELMQIGQSLLLQHYLTVFVLVTQEPLPFAVSDVGVVSVTGHKERAPGIYVGERIASFHGPVCWGRRLVHQSLSFRAAKVYFSGDVTGVPDDDSTLFYKNNRRGGACPAKFLLKLSLRHTPDPSAALPFVCSESRGFVVFINFKHARALNQCSLSRPQ